MNNRFSIISDAPVFKYLVHILDVHTWPTTEEKLVMFGDSEMAELSQHFNDLLLNASCKVENTLPEWDTKGTYLDILKIVFINVLNECKNSLMIPELLLINPFSNSKLKGMFSYMPRIKTDWGEVD